MHLDAASARSQGPGMAMTERENALLKRPEPTLLISLDDLEPIFIELIGRASGAARTLDAQPGALHHRAQRHSDFNRISSGSGFGSLAQHGMTSSQACSSSLLMGPDNDTPLR
ncbi:hypothetical protein [Dyella humicola]|uniref:hypothetical protein n=1 Tax=Dyella humicola TaxID=2992126 RepID=UPI00225AE702|nr:hypothetical protein [Dyella humicola]